MLFRNYIIICNGLKKQNNKCCQLLSQFFFKLSIVDGFLHFLIRAEIDFETFDHLWIESFSLTAPSLQSIMENSLKSQETLVIVSCDFNQSFK